MAMPRVFAALGTPPAAPVPMSYLDDNFTALAPGATTRCTATNANAIVLTPISNQPAVSAYNSMQNFAFLAVANSTASVTVQVIGSGGALVAKKLYKDAAGTLQAGSGDLASGQLYVVSYIPAYDSGNGAFIIAYPTTLSISTAGFVQKSGDTMTGALVLAADPTAALQAATKQYVDTVATGSLSGQVSVQSLVEQFSALGNVSGTVTLPLGTYTNFTMTCTGTTTLAVSGAPASRMVPIVLQITNGGAYTFNWPSGSKFPGGTTLSLTAAGIDVVVGYTIDAGTTIRWMMAQKDSK